MRKVLLTPVLNDPHYDSNERQTGIAELAKLAPLEGYTHKEFTAEHAPNVIAIIANSALFTREFYEAAEDLRLVARWGVGYDKVNLEIATELGIIVTVAPVHMSTVAEYAVTQWLATLKRVYSLNRKAHDGDKSLMRTYDAEGSILGIYGLGRIGQHAARMARPMLGDTGRLLVYDVRPGIAELAAELGAEAVSDPMTLFRECDAISLHVSGDATIVHYDELCAMQPHASLINPSRGNLVDDADVNRAIEEERLFYYVVDDPADGTRAIHRGHPRIICTNHNAGISAESVSRLDSVCFEQVTAAIQGRQPDHVLNEEVLGHPRVQTWLSWGWRSRPVGLSHH